MQIFEAVLLEKNVIFVCDSQVVLGYVIEAVLSFLFPLKWEHVILPMLPNSLVEYLQSPFPIIAGLSSNMIDVDMMNNKVTNELCRGSSCF